MLPQVEVNVWTNSGHFPQLACGCRKLELIAKLAAEAERGYDPTALRGRPRLGAGPAEIVPVRLDPQLRHPLQQRADEEHTTQSDLIRRALRRYLHVA